MIGGLMLLLIFLAISILGVNTACGDPADWFQSTLRPGSLVAKAHRKLKGTI